MKKIVKAMLWKECKFFVKSSFPMFLMYIGAFTFGVWYLLKQMYSLHALSNEVLNSYIFIYILGTIIMAGGISLSLSAAADIKEGTLNSLLASVGKASEVWLGQLLFSEILTLVSVFAGTLGVLVVLKINLGFEFHFEMRSLLLWVIVGPSIGMLYLAVNLFLLWIIRYQAFMMIPGMLMPALIFIGLTKNTTRIAQWDWGIIVALVVLAICFLFKICLTKIIDVVPKQNYVSKL